MRRIEQSSVTTDRVRGGCDAHRTRERLLRRIARSAAAAAAVALVALALAACGGAPSTSGVASLGSTTTSMTSATTSGTTHSTGATSVASMHRSALEYAKCMRSHGLPDFPDPESTGGFVFSVGSGPQPNSPRFQSAQRSCRKYMPNGGKPTPQQSAGDKAQLLELAKCMRSHGVTNFPDPSSRPNGGWGFDITQTSLHVNSPTYQAAAQACQKSVPGGGVPCSGKRRGGHWGGKVRRC
jgi:hypothetical protein